MKVRPNCGNCGGNRTRRVEEHTATLYGGSVIISAHDEPCLFCSVGTVKAERENCFTGQKTAVECLVACKLNETGVVFAVIEGGVTGYEGFGIAEGSADFYNRLIASGSGWTANTKTAGRWDGLFIPASELARVFKTMKLEPEGL